MAQHRQRSLDTAGSYLGSTSFASVYNENQSLQSLYSDLSGRGSALSSQREQFYSLTRESNIRTGAACLSLLKDWPIFDSLIRKWQTGAALILVTPWIADCVSSMKTQVYDRLGSSGDQVDEQLLNCSARIFQNTLGPLELPPGCTLDQYGHQFTGGNTRWETVGIFYTAVGLAAMVVDDVGTIPNSAEKRYVLAKQVLEASDLCLSFCEEFQQLTDPEIWAICDNLHLCSVVTGDASYLTWRRLGTLVSACVAKGLHGKIEVSHEVPFWMSELRKLLFAISYGTDKSISNFLGRPPRLPRKYCTMQLPLDLEPDQLRLPEAELEKVVNKLDQHGWNTNASLRGLVWIRCHFITSMICEDILELALAALPADDASLGPNIIRRSQDSWNSLPTFIKDGSQFPRKTTLEKFVSDTVILGFRYNEFLVQRAMVKRGQTDKRELLLVSRDVFSIVLGLINNNSTGQFACDMPWIIAQFALPVAGVLGLELLQHSYHQKWTDWMFPRSEVIQGLSNLVAAMKWVIPKQDGNCEFTNQARHALERILDLVLGFDRSNKTASATNGPDEGKTSVPSFAWYEQTTSELDFWSSLPKHPLLAVPSS